MLKERAPKDSKERLSPVDEIEEAQRAWENGPLREALATGKERPIAFETSSGAPVKRVYGPRDLHERGVSFARDINFPGAFPYTRGIHPLGYRRDLWDMCQYAGFGTSEQANERLKALVQDGVTALFIALDLPTQLGYDSDNPAIRSDVSKVGVAIDSLEDWERIFDGISLDKLSSVRTTANAIGPVMLAMFLAMAEKQGIPPSRFTVLLQNDILKEFASRNTYIYPVRPSVKLSTDVVEYCLKHVPHWYPLQLSGAHMHSNGGTCVQEVAFTLANGIAYIQSCLERGLDINQFVLRWELLTSGQMDIFEEVAKYRAYRRLWATMLRDRFGATNPEALKIKMTTSAAGVTTTAQEPLNNIVRLALETLAAVLGGGQYIMTPAYDEALGIPTKEAARVALRTQQIIAEETGVANTVDPLGGSWYVESLTDDICKQATAELQKIDRMGGAIEAIERGYFQAEIAGAAYKHQREVESGRRPLVGVNKYHDQAGKEAPPRVFKGDPTVADRQIERLRKLRQRRDAARVQRALKEVEQAARDGHNTVPAMIDAVKAYATIGEVCDALRAVYGEHRPGRMVV